MSLHAKMEALRAAHNERFYTGPLCEAVQNLLAEWDRPATERAREWRRDMCSAPHWTSKLVDEAERAITHMGTEQYEDLLCTLGLHPDTPHETVVAHIESVRLEARQSADAYQLGFANGRKAPDAGEVERLRADVEKAKEAFLTNAGALSQAHHTIDALLDRLAAKGEG